MTDAATPEPAVSDVAATLSARPYCFVLMPFGVKKDPAGGPDLSFNSVYELGIKPAVEDAGMVPIRADHERSGGIIHKPMFERLLLCEFAVADLTTANPNVFYELGVRHAAKPSTTLTLYASRQPIPFDVNFLRSMPYDFGTGNSFGPSEGEALRKSLTERLKALRNLAHAEDAVDSPLFQLISEWRPAPIARDKTDVFRERVNIEEQYRDALEAVRTLGKSKSNAAEAKKRLAEFKLQLGTLDGVETSTCIDLLLTHRALSDWDGMVAAVDAMPEALQRQILVREQLAFAYNRRATTSGGEDRQRALTLLQGVIAQQGPSSETCGLQGRVHKDLWTEALQAGEQRRARGHLSNAIAAYRQGYLADMRDTYPGINLCTLLDIHGDDASKAERDRVLPVVLFAVQVRLKSKDADYWDHATLLELSVLSKDQPAAEKALDAALAAARENWEPETTARNLTLIAEARSARGELEAWLPELIAELNKPIQT